MNTCHMNKIFKNPFFVFIAIISLSVIGVSYKKNDKVNAVTKPQIKGLSKTEGIIGSSVTILGVNLKNVDRIRFGAKDAANFNASANTDSSITVTVPANVIPGNLLLTVYITGVASDQTNFKVVEPPKPPLITSASPVTGSPGTK